MTFLIWSVFCANNILKIIFKTEWCGIIAKKAKNILLTLFKKNQKNGTKAQKEENGIKIEQMSRFLRNALKNVKCVNLRFLGSHGRFIVPTNATNMSMPEKQEKNAPEYVYNLTVERYGVYYANNILVSNCDTLADACRIALIDNLIHKVDHKQNNADAVMNTVAQQMQRTANLRMNRDGLR